MAAAPAIMNREPCFWTSTTPGYNTADRERWILVDGKRVREKHPQRGHIGDYDQRQTAPGERWMLAIRHDGHEGRIVLTNAAAHMDSSTQYGRYVRGKARALGWFHPGKCPCALIASGDLNPHLVVDESVRNGTPCRPGEFSVGNRCPHAIAETKARVARHNVEQQEREAAFKTKEDKVLEAMAAQATAQREQTAALTKAMMDRSEPTKKPKGE